MLNPRLDRVALSSRAFLLTAALLLAIAFPAAVLRAGQTGPLPLEGTVYDSSGAILPQVELTLEDAQHQTVQAASDPSGRFRFEGVAPGKYVLSASLIGFRPLRHELELSQAKDWDRAVTLQVGTLQETISVRSSRREGPAPSPSSEAAPVRVGGNLRAPTKLVDVHPVYPQTMRDAGREGVVPLEAIIGRDGAVVSVRVLSAQVHPDFVRAAIEAVGQWRYEPTLLNGEPVEVSFKATINFALSD
jgi:TonB family protein